MTKSLAPLSQLIAAARTPLATDSGGKKPYLWLAGIAFAVLAVAGSALLMLSLRFFRPELR